VTRIENGKGPGARLYNFVHKGLRAINFSKIRALNINSLREK